MESGIGKIDEIQLTCKIYMNAKQLTMSGVDLENTLFYLLWC